MNFHVLCIAQRLVFQWITHSTSSCSVSRCNWCRRRWRWPPRYLPLPLPPLSHRKEQRSDGDGYSCVGDKSGERTPFSGAASVQRHDLRHRVERWRVALGRSFYLIAARRLYLLKRNRDVSPWARCFVRVKKNRSARTETRTRRWIPESTRHPEKYDYISPLGEEKGELRSRKP